jgi:hypothetical protein
MSSKAKLFVFIPCVLLGLFLQLDLGIHCRCPWGDWSSRFIHGAMALDLLLITRVAYTVAKHQFYRDCLWVGGIVLTSVFWIPLVYKATTALYLLATEGRVGELGH